MSIAPHLETAEHGSVGEQDAALSGWQNHATGELAPGFPISADDVVVDVGAGEGGYAMFCGGRGAHVVVCDVNPDKVARARARVEETGARRVEAIVGDGVRLPLPDGYATRVICTEVLEHVDDPRASMAELARLVAPGGLVLVTVPGARLERIQQRVAFPYYFEKPNHIRIIDADALDALVEGAGLTAERRDTDGFFWSIYLSFVWQSGAILFGRNEHPTLARWSRTWQRVLEGPDGPKIKRALDAVLPRRQIVVARKPGRTP